MRTKGLQLCRALWLDKAGILHSPRSGSLTPPEAVSLRENDTQVLILGTPFAEQTDTNM
jgi:hypothetical protein